jgi:hypothetical protein
MFSAVVQSGIAVLSPERKDAQRARARCDIRSGRITSCICVSRSAAAHLAARRAALCAPSAPGLLPPFTEYCLICKSSYIALSDSMITCHLNSIKHKKNKAAHEGKKDLPSSTVKELTKYAANHEMKMDFIALIIIVE